MMTMKIVTPIILFTCILMSGCSKSDHNDNPSEDNNETYGNFTFTARGETVTCTDTENQGTYVHDLHGANHLTIFGINRDVPENKENTVSIELMLQGELKPGAYSFVDAGQWGNCIGNSSSACNNISFGQVLPNDDINYDEAASKKVLQSTGGTLNITSVTIGKYVNGFAEGKISGTFSYSGTNLWKLDGTASGKFEDIPLLSAE